jgi:purine nucleosidase
VSDAARRPLIIDTDPGIDDAMAIAVALAAPQFEVIALTTVFGNHHLDVTTANAQRVLDHLGEATVPVVRGADRPLVQAPNPPATFVHGEDGLGDIDLPAPSRPPVADQRAAEFIVAAARTHQGRLTLATIGPLTNLALALRLEPELPDLLGQVVVMGGAARAAGNVSPTSEANIWNDPHAAEIVFGTDLDLTMIGLDVTHQILADLAWIERLATVDTSAAQLIARTAPVYVEFHRRHDSVDGIHCHDVATIAYLLAPHLFDTTPLRVRVVTDGLALGATVAADKEPHDDDGGWAARPRTNVALGVDAPAVLQLVWDHLASPAIL